MLTTLPVFHLEMSWLKLDAPDKRFSMLWTWLTSQSGMSVEPAAPQFATPVEQHFSPVGTSLRHELMAALRALLLVNGAP